MKVQTNAQGKVYLTTGGKALFQPYNGTEITYTQYGESIGNVSITGKSGASNIALPDYSVVSSVNGCMGAEGHSYFSLVEGYSNFDVFGSPTINQTTGLVSGFSGYNFLGHSVFDTSLPWELGLKINTSSASTSQNYFSLLDNGFAIVSSKWAFYLSSSNGSSFDICNGTKYGTVSSNTWYWLKFIYDGTKYEFYTSTDGENYSLVATISSSLALKMGSYFWIGCYDGGTTNPLSGSIDLSACYIKVNGETWWSPLGAIPQEKAGLLATTDDGSAQTWNLFYNNGFVLDTASSKSGYSWCGSVSVPAHTVYPSYKKGDFSVVGTLYSNNFRLMGFTSANYIATNYTFSMTPEQFNQGFTIQVHIITPSSYASVYEKIFCCGTSYNNGPCGGFGSGNGLPVMILSSGGTVFIEIYGDTALTPNTEYWLRLTKPNTQYFAHDTLLQISTDGINWTTVGSSSTTISQTVTANGTMVIARNPTSTGEYFRGQIDLRDTFIEIAGTRVWSALI